MTQSAVARVARVDSPSQEDATAPINAHDHTRALISCRGREVVHRPQRQALPPALRWPRPSTLLERDLDDDAVGTFLAAAEETPRQQPLAVVMTISEEPEPRLAPDVIVEAVRGHFIYEGEQVERRLREHVRRGQMFLVVGLTVLVVFVTLARLTASLPAGPLIEILREGFIITGWVAMWRPVEVLLYGWWPFIDERRRVRRMLDAPVSIRYGGVTAPADGTG